MRYYDPEHAPDPQEWLACDEQERMLLVEQHHRAARIKLPSIKAHAAFHAMVENQIAEGREPVVRAMERLTREGLSRHDAVHAVASVAAEQLHEAVNSKDEDSAATVQARYDAAVERLTAKEWLRKYESS